ncbi:MAG TPA: S-methyl-5-thioribose-1-phosphate isomerase [Anaerolineaceae bacterium]|nr:S-methyl-5-thioribose-1-phosphate isomerase [Anaerolineaceae bacterium]HPN50807.1 S-methyl-5-thioribose-1-phosphate isomerase [Anaerolineaceae bacterium]
MRTLEWVPSSAALQMIDQRILPERLELVTYTTYQEVAEAIRIMVIRGAPAIGAAGAFGMAMAGFQSSAQDGEAFLKDMETAYQVLNASRPTAVNLKWGLDQMMSLVKLHQGSIHDLRNALLAKAQQIADEDVEINKKIAAFGAELIDDGDTLIHHCNTGALATVDWGTALGVIRLAFEQGKKIHVLVDETRPRLQGARLTAWELQQYGIPFDIISDNAAGYFLRSGQVQKVFFGADRVASNGDVANKVGSYMLALAAYDNSVPVYSVFPSSTVDLTLSSGDEIPIEEREGDEVLDIQIKGERATPRGATARNPAFDVTPNRLLSGLVTEKGIIRPPFHLHLPETLKGA